jgi:hypothetical protein
LTQVPAGVQPQLAHVATDKIEQFLFPHGPDGAGHIQQRSSVHGVSPP